MSRALTLAGLLLALALVAPAAASAHAVLLGSEPARGVTVQETPTEVILQFSEPVEAAFGALRVIGADGERVDDGRSGHPDGRKNELRAGLRPDVADGTYVATYRVISADSHPVSGAVVFSVGEAGDAPANVESLLNAEAGPVTENAMKAARGVGYAATVAAVGGLVFLLLVWSPAARAVGISEAAVAVFGARLQLVLGIAVAAGALATAAGFGLQAAIASATTFWGALDTATLRELLNTNFGQAWGLRLVAFAALGVVIPLLRPAVGAPASPLPPVEVGAPAAVHAGAPAPSPGTGRAAALTVAALACAALIITPALAGHARATTPVGLNVAVDALHLAVISVWIGGLVMLLFAVPAATRALVEGERTRLLAAVLQRFSPLALGCVALAVGTGAFMSVVHLTALGELVDSDWGRLVLVKIVLFGGLVALGAVNQRRIMPRLRALASHGDAPGGAGRFLRATLRAEVALAVVVLGVTAVLVGISPPAAGAGSGPVSIEEQVGPLQLQATVDPGTAGANEVHLYLLRSDGQPFDGTKELRMSAALPAEDIGPIGLEPRKAGPGHYIVDSLPLSPGGDWELAVAVRVSEFDQYDTRLDVPVR